MSIDFRGFWSPGVLRFQPNDVVIWNDRTWIAVDYAHYWDQPGSGRAESVWREFVVPVSPSQT